VILIVVINMIMSIMCMNLNLPLFDIYLTIPTLPCIALHHFMSSFLVSFHFEGVCLISGKMKLARLCFPSANG